MQWPCLKEPQVDTWSRWSSGSFVVVWEDDPPGDGRSQVLASGFDPRGRPMFRDLHVHDEEVEDQAHPTLCVDENGAFVVAWEAGGAEAEDSSIYMSAFDCEGERRFPVRRVNRSEDRHQRPDVALRSKGDFVVVWEKAAGEGGFDVVGAGFDEKGESRFAERALPAVSTGIQRHPRVDVAEDGSFLTSWMDDADGNDYYEIRVNRRSRDG